jgi:hypothetical protein
VSAYPERLPRNNCRQNARWMTLMHPELSQVEGYLVLTGHDGAEWRLEHSWNRAPDGTVVDSTVWAIAGELLPYRYEPDPHAWSRLAETVAAIESERGRDAG